MDGENEGAYTMMEKIPLMLSAFDVAAVLNISKSLAYELMQAKDFPTVKVGKRLRVSRDALFTWISANTQ